MKIYLDNCCYNRPYDDQTQMRIAIETQAKLYIQRLIVEQKLDLVVSFISRYENKENPEISNREAISAFFENAIEYVSNARSGNIKKQTIEFIKQGIKVKDALHISCAIEAHCDYFITTDDRILKSKISKIAIYSPVEFINIFTESNNA
jgi:predicted nucleic acid-binding protein